MVTPELLNFIKQKSAQGAGGEEIKTELLANGWQLADINEGFAAMNQGMASSSSIASALKFLKNPKILYAIIAAIVVLGAAYVIYALTAKPKKQAPASSAVNQTQSNPQSAATAPAQNSSARKPATAVDPGEIYLAYKKDLYTRTETALEIVALFRKYRPATIVRQWDAEGIDKVFPTSKETCALLVSLRLTNPDNTLVRVDEQKQVNPQSVTLSVSAAGGYKGSVQMTLEADGWKVYQESWPTWQVDVQKLANSSCP